MRTQLDTTKRCVATSFCTLCLGGLSVLMNSCGEIKKADNNAIIATKIGFRNPPKEGSISECIRFALSTEDANGITPPEGEEISLNLSATLGAFYSDSECQKPLSQAVIAQTQTSVFVYFKTPTPGEISLKAAAAPDAGLFEGALSIKVKTDATRLAFSESVTNGLYSKCLPISIRVLNGSSQDSQLGYKLPVTFTAKYNQDQTTLGEFFKDSRCKESQNIIEIPPNKSEATIFFLTNEPGEYKVTALIPKGAGIDPPPTLELNARTELFGTWYGPCIETAPGAATRMQRSIAFDDLDLVYTVSYFSGQSGACIDAEKSHWTNFTATYSLPEHATEQASSADAAPGKIAQIDVVYKTSCVGVKSQSKAASYRTSNNCGTSQWQESSNACNETTGKSGCEPGTSISADTKVFDIFQYGPNTTSVLQLSQASLLPDASTSSEKSRPASTTATPYTLAK